ncbi:hypothetical protein [Pseudomonas putida]|uniref:Uncharacterized protein n=1 Tax=Pseudomonas putida TaxID=303 RepID=A0A8I1JJ18_PSEPU|nr:hypothetical protein [Pseudomonas putida]MBI6883149.1 hypothetical protein [Pseudomonas putida]
MTISLKSLTAIFFTGIVLQAFVFDRIEIGADTMKRISPFYSPQLKQSIYADLAAYQVPSRH